MNPAGLAAHERGVRPATPEPMTGPLPHCLGAAGAHDAHARCAFTVDGVAVGSVARIHLEALGAWPRWLRIERDQVALTATPPARDAALAEMHLALHAAGLLRGWRDETFALLDPATLAVLARIERAASRFWGALTFGAHATGYVADAAGRPTHLWIARRSTAKATDPGLFDNLVGGGVPDGQTPHEALVREAFEEAGLTPAQVRPARAAGVLRVHRDIPEGLQHEWVHSFDLALPAGLVPQNQDGEVAGFTLMPAADAVALAYGGEMTVDAALVTVDFGWRHGLLGTPGVAEALARLRVRPPR